MDVDVVRVFTDEVGRHGNPLGVVLDAAELSIPERQSIATALGYSETVFVDDVEEARFHLFTPACELPFAGHPLVGMSWFLARQTGYQPDLLRPARLTDPVPTRAEGDITWIRGRLADTPAWEHVQMAEATQIDDLVPPERGGGWQKTQLWAWVDESVGTIRARVFALDFDVVEDEACGSATMLLADRVGRTITVRHGQGSQIWARPLGSGDAEVGGRVVYDGRRPIVSG